MLFHQTSLPALSVTLLLAACSGQVDTGAAGAPVVDYAFPVSGVRDRAADPAVVAIDVGGQAWCSGSLLAPDVVLTARRCVTTAPALPACPNAADAPLIAPRSIRVLAGEALSVAVERARGTGAVVPSSPALCGADIAVITLDTPIDGIQALAVRGTGAARGDHVRAVSYGASGDKLVRDHLAVPATTPAELRVAEACGGTAGGPAIDEASGEIVGVMSRAGGGPSCKGPGASDVYTRADAFFALVDQALAGVGIDATAATVATRGSRRAKKGPVDAGANCAHGSDCAAGVCVTERSAQYCSRTCDPTDPCPTRFRCRKSAQGPPVDSICVEN